MSEHLVSDGYKLDNERDAMAWQVLLELVNSLRGPLPEYAAHLSYEYTDAFLAERKRQQGEA